jgi:hypothetical protein
MYGFDGEGDQDTLQDMKENVSDLSKFYNRDDEVWKFPMRPNSRHDILESLDRIGSIPAICNDKNLRPINEAGDFFFLPLRHNVQHILETFFEVTDALGTAVGHIWDHAHPYGEHELKANDYFELSDTLEKARRVQK